MALFRGEVRFERIEAGQRAVLRLPAAPDSDEEDRPALPFFWPKLPYALTVEQLSVSEVALGESILGEQAPDGRQSSSSFCRTLPRSRVSPVLRICSVVLITVIPRSNPRRRPRTSLAAIAPFCRMRTGAPRNAGPAAETG